MSISDDTKSGKRPNIVVILVDDLGYSDLGCYGGEIETPNLDKLAANGLRFTHFYNVSCCCPSRASLLTGLYPHQAGMGHLVIDYFYADFPDTEAYKGELGQHCVTSAEVLRTAGYRTYMTGKWHVVNYPEDASRPENWPLQRGFDRYYGILTGGANYFEPKLLTRDNTFLTSKTDPEYQPENYYITDAFSDNAVRYLEDHDRDYADTPFFMYVAYNAPHSPMHAPEEDIAHYAGRYDAGYDAIRQARIEKQKRIGLIEPDSFAGPTVGDWNALEDQKWEARCMETFAAMVSRVDAGVGRIVETLRESGKLDNTLILFLSDNGGAAESSAAQTQRFVRGGPDSHMSYGENWANVSNTPLRLYKQWEHEGGISTPFIVHWPNAVEQDREGSFVDAPGHLIDLMATFVELSGAAYPTQRANNKSVWPMEGVSLASLIANGAPLNRPAPLFWEHQANRAVRDGKWKLAWDYRREAWELYDTDIDRSEMHDLAGQYPELVNDLAAQWDAWAQRVGVVPDVNFRRGHSPKSQYPGPSESA